MSETEISRYLSKDKVSREAVVVLDEDSHLYTIHFYGNKKYVYSQKFTKYNGRLVEDAAEDYAINGNVYGTRENYLFKLNL